MQEDISRFERGEMALRPKLLIAYCRALDVAPWYPVMDETERRRAIGIDPSFKPGHQVMRFEQTATTLMAAMGFVQNKLRNKGWYQLAKAIRMTYNALYHKVRKSRKAGVYVGQVSELISMAKALNVRPFVWFMLPDELEAAEVIVGVTEDSSWQ